MASPFPGMDPYLEEPAIWPDFHATFINYAREALLDSLPAHYTARIGVRIDLIDEPPRREKSILPDIAVERPNGAGGAAVATAVCPRPVTLMLPPLAQPRQTYIEILHREDRSLVSVLELLSPSNKEQPGRALYLAKRNALIIRDVNIIELDLLLVGQRPPLREEMDLPQGDYYAFVSPGDRRPDCDVYAWQMPDPLPVLPIPLRAPDGPVMLQMAAVFAQAYQRGGFAREIDYTKPPPVRVSDERLKWIASVIAARPE